MNPLDSVILALDTSNADTARRWLGGFPEIRRIKIGLQLYLAGGRELVRRFVDDGYWIFLDLKLHDIPNTVARAIEEICDLGVQLTTVHGLGGPRMIEAARQARERAGSGLAIVAVTALTSHSDDEWRGLGFRDDLAQSALRLASGAWDAGAEGVVCSPHETRALREALGEKALLVVPGIRLPGQSSGDQRRIAGPGATRRAGATYLVMGRSLTDAESPQATLQALADDLGS